MSFVCRVCGTTLKTAWGLRLHEQRHDGLGKYACCQKSFLTKESLTRHMCSTHGESMQYVCTKCKQVFATQADLTRHRRREDGNLAECKCDIRGLSFTEKNDLKAHMNSHTGEKGYTCKDCGKSYRHRSSLCKHRSLKHSE
ncbi:oocyte zinc finger protein XlCOF6-like [Mya arenaria]|uniref:oocyte zinc finger protein XlCOF6-like n=1 Tax=Mya arenaria TaxID=6604 RepID=UPI0022E231C4|nr:oocyte zinc finger protein XlCOF6-like [Mya arenaria]